MRRYLLGLILGVLLAACGFQAGEIGHRCRDGSCFGKYAVCGPDNICVTCGREEGQPCCRDGTCEGEFSSGTHLDCSAESICVPCGLQGEACCSDGTCGGSAFCGEDGLCHACGRAGQVCCPGLADCWGGDVCASDGFCYDCGQVDEPCCEGNTCSGRDAMNPLVCNADGMCQLLQCGSLDEPCCDGQTCDSWLMCSAEGLCQSCGYIGEVPCPQGGCDAWFVEFEGLCVIPFIFDPDANVALCEGADDSGVYPGKENSNWCLWYAAYYTSDLRLCDEIGWDEMREKCAAGKDPEDYIVFEFGEY